MTLTVQPASATRVDFAQWVNRNSARMIDGATFQIGDDLIATIPGHLLDGSVIDGQPWITPDSQTAKPSSARTKEN